MTDLVDEVKHSFELTKEGNDSPIQLITGDEDDLAPGFTAMRAYYEQRLIAITRRAYRFFAGGTLSRNADELMATTGEQMLPTLVATLLRAFADGVLIGQQNEQIVRMALHFHHPEHLYHDDDFLESAKHMALGLVDDDEVRDYFSEYAQGGLHHLAHSCGFAHQEVEPAKVWDLWLMTGTACVCSSFLAGQKLGTAWRERDVLDGIAIATEEVPDGSEGEDSTDS